MAIECILLAVPLIVFSLFLNSPAKPQGDIGQAANNTGRFHRALCVVPCTRVVNRDSPGTTHDPRGGPQLAINSARSPASVTGNSLYLLGAEAGGSEERGESLLANIVTGIGAGIYEELVFRLILIIVLMLLFQDVLGFSRKGSIILSILVSAGLFSAHHHIIFVDGQLTPSAVFSWTAFCFRTIAGVYFAALFAIRGFGITAGTHAFYDIIATIINVIFFGSGN